MLKARVRKRFRISFKGNKRVGSHGAHLEDVQRKGDPLSSRLAWYIESSKTAMAIQRNRLPKTKTKQNKTKAKVLGEV